MIPLNIQRSQLKYKCHTDPQYSALGLWLEVDLGRTGGGFIEELFEDIGALYAGTKKHVEVWGDQGRVRIGREGAAIQSMPDPGPPCEISVDELVDAVLRWFDAVNPELASELRKIQSGWKPSSRIGTQ